MKEQARKTAESVNVCVCVRVSEGRGGDGGDGAIFHPRSAEMSTTGNNTIHYPASGWVDRELLTSAAVKRDHKLCV